MSQLIKLILGQFFEWGGDGPGSKEFVQLARSKWLACQDLARYCRRIFLWRIIFDQVKKIINKYLFDKIISLPRFGEILKKKYSFANFVPDPPRGGGQGPKKIGNKYFVDKIISQDLWDFEENKIVG